MDAPFGLLATFGLLTRSSETDFGEKCHGVKVSGTLKGQGDGRVDALAVIGCLRVWQRRKNDPRLPVWSIVPIVLGMRWSFAKSL